LTHCNDLRFAFRQALLMRWPHTVASATTPDSPYSLEWKTPDGAPVWSGAALPRGRWPLAQREFEGCTTVALWFGELMPGPIQLTDDGHGGHVELRAGMSVEELVKACLDSTREA